MNHPLKDKLALVTGASGGIGAAIARKLAKDGASILVHYNSSKAEAEKVMADISSSGGSAEIAQADLSTAAGIDQLISSINISFDGRYKGKLDLLVNNAGVLNVNSLIDVTDEQFDVVFDVNVRATFKLSREAARRMSKAGWGRIINIGSVFGSAVPGQDLSIYSASKFTIQGFTRGWSRDLGPLGITVNNVQPAVIQSEPVPTEGPTFEAMKKYTSVGRFGTAEEVADTVAFLAQPSSAFINGATINVDGGWNA